MAATVSLAKLRVLARAYTEGVEGVSDELVAIARSCPSELAKALCVQAEILDRVQWSETSAAGLVRLIESAPARVRALRQQDVAATTSRLAGALGETAVLDDGGSVRVNLDLLGELVRVTRGYETLVFKMSDGEVRVVNLVVLQALLRECKGVEVDDVLIGRDDTIVRYRSRGGRGFVRLHNLSWRAAERAVVVDVPIGTAAALPCEPVPAAGETPPTLPTPDEALPVLPPRVRRPFLHYVLEAFAARGSL